MVDGWKEPVNSQNTRQYTGTTTAAANSKYDVPRISTTHGTLHSHNPAAATRTSTWQWLCASSSPFANSVKPLGNPCNP